MTGLAGALYLLKLMDLLTLALPLPSKDAYRSTFNAKNKRRTKEKCKRKDVFLIKE